MLGIQLQNTLCVYTLTAVDSSLLVVHLLHLERYRAFSTQAARMALETAGQLDLLNLALERLAERFEDILIVSLSFLISSFSSSLSRPRSASAMD